MLKNRRKKLGITQEKLADVTNVTQPFISRVENCRIRNVTINFIDKLSKELLLNPVDVFLFFYNIEISHEDNIEIDIDNKFEDLRNELEELYLKEGLTDRVVKFSEKLDEIIIDIQNEKFKYYKRKK